MRGGAALSYYKDLGNLNCSRVLICNQRIHGKVPNLSNQGVQIEVTATVRKERKGTLD
jgi:hypothetical protein